MSSQQTDFRQIKNKYKLRHFIEMGCVKTGDYCVFPEQKHVVESALRAAGISYRMDSVYGYCYRMTVNT